MSKTFYVVPLDIALCQSGELEKGCIAKLPLPGMALPNNDVQNNLYVYSEPKKCLVLYKVSAEYLMLLRIRYVDSKDFVLKIPRWNVAALWVCSKLLQFLYKKT